MKYSWLILLILPIIAYSQIEECTNFKPKFDSTYETKLIVNNKGNTDMVIKLMEIESNIAIRMVYINSGDKEIINHIPQGKYYLKEAFGDTWKQVKKDGKCFGQFTDSYATYIVGEEILDYHILKKVIGKREQISVPGYELELGIVWDEVYLKDENVQKTKSITLAEFNE